jgi:hypothetical protein
MSQYRKKPVVIEAIQWTGENLREIIDFTGLHPSALKWAWEEYEEVVRTKGLKIFTREDPLTASIGDWIIRGIKGEFYPCKPDIFAATYEPPEAHAEAGELPWKCECGAILYAEGRHQRQDCLDEREHVGHLVRFDRRRTRPALAAPQGETPAPNSHWYVSDQQWDRLRRLLDTPHPHSDGMNECAICDESLMDAAVTEIERLRTRPAPAEGLLGEALRKKRDEYKGFYAQGYRDMKIFEVITMIDFLLLAALSTAPAPAIQGVRELQDLYVRWVSDMVLSSANEPPIVDETSESYKQGYQDALVKCSKELRDCIHTPEPPQGDAK